MTASTGSRLARLRWLALLPGPAAAAALLLRAGQIPAPMQAPADARPDVVLCLNGDVDFGRIRLASSWLDRSPASRLLISGAGVAGDSAWYLAGSALALGVAPERISLETSARTTHDNFALSRPLLASLGARSVLVVTERSHARRSVLTAEAALPGLVVWVDSPPSRPPSLAVRWRELLKTARYAWLGHLPWSALVR